MTAWRLGLLGHPVSHSRSPALHRAALRALGLDGDYQLFDVPPQGVDGWLDAVRAGSLDGFNVTIPHKLAMYARMDRCDAEAAALGAVNTVVREPDGTLVGHNTDVSGLRRAVTEALPEPAAVALAGRAVAILGAGGAAYAAVRVARQLVGPRGQVRVANRTARRAEALAAVVPGVTVAPSAQAACAGAALLIQATSMGMGSAPQGAAWTQTAALAAPLVAALAPGALVYDLVYTPRHTPWVAAAQAAGRAASDGLGMLVHQAADAFTVWTGHPAPRDAMWRAVGSPP